MVNVRVTPTHALSFDDGRGRADLRISLLGPVRAWRGPAEIDLGTPQQRTVLALLATQGGPVPRDRLIDGVYGERPPGCAPGLVSTYASRLRKVFEPERTPRSHAHVLTSGRGGYELHIDKGGVDVHAFAAAVEQARERRGTGDLHGASALFERALSLWRGEPLSGLAGPWAQENRTALEEQRIGVMEERWALELELGRHAALTSELAAAAARFPLRENLHALLMRALYRSGRQADALRAFAEARSALVSELGIEPCAELRELHRRILDGERDDDARPAPSYAPEGRTRPAQLPPALRHLTGRDAHAAAMAAALTAPDRRSVPVCLVSGTAGVGKAALALDVAHRVAEHFPDGQLHARLEGPLAEPAAVLGQFLLSCGVRADDVPDGLEARAAAFRSVLAGRRVLVVLEGVVSSAQLSPLLPGAPTAGVIATARRPLPMPLVTDHVPLDVLSPADARELLVLASGRERRSAPDGDWARLAELCGRLPLALRSAAARLMERPVWTVAHLADRLADERRLFTELRCGGTALDSAFAADCDRLDAEHARALRLLAGPDAADISPASAAACLGVGVREAEELLEGLVDAGVLDAPGLGVYRFPGLLRTFVRGR
ncbi:AfsR/SARP family transcriptional regulator [Streptomyces sp. NPDC051162]|uniref:AfsR/SARP family transcriptional regulator n=1 Tax=unclassified Streptomyces TaxID=2593676 RepID=UPI0034171841